MLLSVFAVGCGPPAYIRATIAASETTGDLLRLSISADTDDAEVLGTRDYDITERAFPLTVVFEPDDDAPHDVRVIAGVYAADVLVGETTARFTWRDDSVNEVTLALP